MEKNNRTVEDIMKNEGIELWGLCGFSEVRPLLDCRAASRIPTNAKTVIFFAFPYRKEESVGEGRNLSLYACVEDYHTVCTARLSLLCERLKETFPTSSFEAFVDNSPIREVYGAAKAGLGKIGRNGLLITKKYGSYVFIGEIVTDLKLAVAPSEVACCDGCNRCVLQCPTGASSEAGLDKSRCLSHISQKKGTLTPEEEGLLRKGGLVWGCDHCQQVCPMNAGSAFAGEELFENVHIRADLGEPDTFFRTRAYSFRGKAPIERNIRLLEEDEKR